MPYLIEISMAPAQWLRRLIATLRESKVISLIFFKYRHHINLNEEQWECHILLHLYIYSSW